MNNPPRPLPFVLAATEQGMLIVNHLDYRMTDQESGIGVGYQLLTTAHYDAVEIANAGMLLALQRTLRGDGVVALDCGANIGIHAISWARQMTGWGTVLAFEAQERIFYALAGNICLNNCFNARAFHVAIGETDGSLDIPLPDYRRPASFGSLELRGGEAAEYIGQDLDYSASALQTVKMMRIDSMNLPRVDFIKIDVEGMEKEALAGARSTIQRCRPVLVVEHLKSDITDLRDFFAKAGYNCYASSMNLLAVPQGDPIEQKLEIRGINS
jgi:FkbM family methyltransferase